MSLCLICLPSAWLPSAARAAGAEIPVCFTGLKVGGHAYVNMGGDIHDMGKVEGVNEDCSLNIRDGEHLYQELNARYLLYDVRCNSKHDICLGSEGAVDGQHVKLAKILNNDFGGIATCAAADCPLIFVALKEFHPDSSVP